MHLLFVRHGEDEDNANGILNGHRDRPLTVRGQKQALAAARRLSILQPDVIFVSPLFRARETATIIANRLGIREVSVVPELIERDFGVMTGVSYSDISRLAKNTIQAHGFTMFLEAPQSETYPTVVCRVQSSVDSIRRQHSNHRVLLVSHGDVFKALLMALEGRTLEESYQAPWLENAEIADFGLLK